MGAKTAKTNEYSNRVVRLFVSSTFRDMQDEREALSLMFPALRQHCRERDLEFMPVDLRWGITQEEAENDRTIEICMDEISRCAPFFIAILGDRYGWIPEEIPKTARAKHPFLEAETGRSITEMEIVFGGLNNPKSFFYQRRNIDLNKTDEKQEKLKTRILASKKRIKTYSSVSELAEWVLSDMIETIDARYPSEIRKGDALHYGFAVHAADGYIDFRGNEREIDAYVSGTDRRALLLTGETGSGKSVLLADYALKHRGTHLFYHSCNASGESADLLQMTIRMLDWLEDTFGIDCEMDKQPQDIIYTLPAYLEKAAETADKIIIVIDGAELFVNPEGRVTFAWIPETLPENVKMILSARNDADVIKTGKRTCRHLRINLPTADDIRIVVQQYLAGYGKRLEKENIDKIAASKKAARPYYLIAVLEELRKFGIYEMLDEKVEELLSCETTADITRKFLARYEKNMPARDFEFFRHALIYMYVSGDGLGEHLLKELLAIPNAYTWASVFSAILELCYIKVRTVAFKNREIRCAVQIYFGLSDERPYALRLIDTLSKGEDGEKIHLLPALCMAYGQNNVLYDMMADPKVFADMYRRNHWSARSVWSYLEKNGYHKLAAYQPLIERPKQYSEESYAVAMVLFDTGHPNEAFGLLKLLANERKAHADWNGYQDILGRLANIHHREGRYGHAKRLYEMQTNVCRAYGLTKGYLRALGNLGLLYHQTGETESALTAYEQSLTVARENSYFEEEQKLLSHIGYLYINEYHDTRKARDVFRQQQALCEKIGSISGTAAALDALSQIEIKNQNFSAAQRFLEQEQALLEKIEDTNALQICIGNYASVLYEQHLVSAAIAQYRRKIKMCENIGNTASLIAALKNLSVVYLQTDRYEDVLPVAERMNEAARAQKDVDAVLMSGLYLAAASKKLGRSYLEKLDALEVTASLLGRDDVLGSVMSLRNDE